MHLGFIILIIILIEVSLTLFFTLITPKNKKKTRWDFKSIFKGLVERLFITYSLLSGIPHAITLFGALKLGTRLKRADDTKTEESRKKEAIYNDYYLIGNLISVAASILYFNLLK